jgi:hypothetical protein
MPSQRPSPRAPRCNDRAGEALRTGAIFGIIEAITPVVGG